MQGSLSAAQPRQQAAKPVGYALRTALAMYVDSRGRLQALNIYRRLIQESCRCVHPKMSSTVSVAISSLKGGDLHQRLAARLSQLTTLTDAERIYNEALRRVASKYDRDEIPKEQLDRLLSTTCSEDLLREVEDAKVRSRAARKVVAPRWLKRTGQWSLETLERFSQCTDVMVQHRKILCFVLERMVAERRQMPR